VGQKKVAGWFCGEQYREGSEDQKMGYGDFTKLALLYG